jgi:aminopeptidase N
VEAEMNLLELAGAGREVAQTGIMRGGFNTAANVKYAANLSTQAFRLFEYLYGPLPYKAVSVTEQPIRGYGQSWPNLIFLPYDSLLDSTTRHSLKLQESAEAREFYNTVAVHEMSHQWWGHLVGWKTYHDQWLSEGMADHASALYLRQFEPNKWNSFWDLRRTWLLSKNNSGYRPVDAGPIWLNEQLNEHNQFGNSNLIYYKGAYVLEMLRSMMFDTKSADNRYIAMMHDFTKTYSGQNASTEDFQRIVEKHMGEPMDWFFDEWVYGTEIPTYDFSYKLTDAGGGQTELSATLVPSGVSKNFRMRLPLFVVLGGTPRYLGSVQVTGTEPYSFTTKLPVKPDKVLLDAQHSILANIHQ